MATENVQAQGLNEVLNAPFGVVIKKEKEKKREKDSNSGFIVKYGLVFNPDTQRTEIVVSEKIDIYKLVQSYKEECGIEAALRLIKLGRASAEDFADDGKHGYDVTGIPQFAGDALRQLEPGIKAGEKLAKDLGLPSGINATEEEIQVYVERALKKIQEKQATATVAEGEKKDA